MKAKIYPKDGRNVPGFQVAEETFSQMESDFAEASHIKTYDLVDKDLLPNGKITIDWTEIERLVRLPDSSGGLTHRSYRGPGGGRRR